MGQTSARVCQRATASLKEGAHVARGSAQQQVADLCGEDEAAVREHGGAWVQAVEQVAGPGGVGVRGHPQVAGVEEVGGGDGERVGLQDGGPVGQGPAGPGVQERRQHGQPEPAHPGRPPVGQPQGQRHDGEPRPAGHQHGGQRTACRGQALAPGCGLPPDGDRGDHTEGDPGEHRPAPGALAGVGPGPAQLRHEGRRPGRVGGERARQAPCGPRRGEDGRAPERPEPERLARPPGQRPGSVEHDPPQARHRVEVGPERCEHDQPDPPGARFVGREPLDQRGDQQQLEQVGPGAQAVFEEPEHQGHDRQGGPWPRALRGAPAPRRQRGAVDRGVRRLEPSQPRGPVQQGHEDLVAPLEGRPRRGGVRGAERIDRRQPVGQDQPAGGHVPEQVDIPEGPPGPRHAARQDRRGEGHHGAALNHRPRPGPARPGRPPGAGSRRGAPGG